MKWVASFLAFALLLFVCSTLGDDAASALLIGLPIIFIIGTVFAASSRLTSKSRDERQIQSLLASARAICDHARRSTPTTGEREAFARHVQQCRQLVRSRTQEEWGCNFRHVPEIADGLDELFLAFTVHVASQPSSSVSEIETLARLRNSGMISSHEFDAFSERFRVSSGQKAGEIIDAIGSLYGQYERGAMSEGNYHASLWGLMDKLDRKI